MIKPALIALACSATLVTALPAGAYPAAKPTGLEASSQVTAVGWRCGRFRHWSYRLHRCVRN